MTSDKTTKIDLHAPPKLMSFKQFLASDQYQRLRQHNKTIPVRSRNANLHETIGNFNNEVDQTMVAAIPSDASNRETLMFMLTNELRKMSASMDIVVTAVGFEPGDEDK